MLQSLLDSFKIEPLVLLFNGVMFLLLVQVLDKLFWKPVLRHLDNRKEEIARAYKTVDDTRREMENLRADYQQRLSKIEADARTRIQQTVGEAQRQRESMIAEARSQSEEIVRRGEESIANEKEVTLAAVRDRIDDAAAIALTKVIGVAPDAAQLRLVDEYISQHVVLS
jgi:F-type H+-transporting ATPase subunit b